jgi:SAM-dependent methyltransferase
MTTPGNDALYHPRYVRSNAYEPQWIFDNQMGPNALWLMESLSEVMPITRGMRVLDLGCGTAMTSIFLAREFGTAANQQRICAAKVQDLVVPIHAEAHQLPFAAEFFDAIVSVDAYQYFGTDDLYLGYITEFLRPGGQIGIVVPAMFTELGAGVPAELAPFWDWEFCCFHGPNWWRTHWEKTGKVRVEHADAIEDGWRDWLRFAEASAPFLEGWREEAVTREIGMLQADQGNLLGFSRIVATR